MARIIRIRTSASGIRHQAVRQVRKNRSDIDIDIVSLLIALNATAAVLLRTLSATASVIRN